MVVGDSRLQQPPGPVGGPEQTLRMYNKYGTPYKSLILRGSEFLPSFNKAPPGITLLLRAYQQIPPENLPMLRNYFPSHK